MKTWMKAIVVLGMMCCLGMAVSVPRTHAAEATSAKATAAKPMAKTTHKHHRMAKLSAEVKKAQEMLIKDGAKIKADGIMGKHTRLAIKDFQKKNNLKVTGKLDKETLAKLQ